MVQGPTEVQTLQQVDDRDIAWVECAATEVRDAFRNICECDVLCRVYQEAADYISWLERDLGRQGIDYSRRPAIP